eukprot:Stramenopile-MAST_4_protein_2799
MSEKGEPAVPYNVATPGVNKHRDADTAGEQIGRFRDYPLPWELSKGTSIDRVAGVGRASIAFRAKTGTEAPYSDTFDLVHRMGLQVQSLTRAANLDKPDQAIQLLTKDDIESFGSDWNGTIAQKNRPPFSISDVFSSKSSISNASSFIPVQFNPTKFEEDPDSECDSDEDWDTSEWGRLEIQNSVKSLLETIEKCDSDKVPGLKRRKLAIGMLIKLVKKHVSALEYLEGGMERLMEKALRNANQEQTTETKNVVPALASLAAVPAVATKISTLNGSIKTIKCMNQAINLAVSLVQSMFRHHEYVVKKSHMFPPAVRARTKAMQLMHIHEIKEQFKMVRNTPTGGDVPDHLAYDYCRLLYNLTRPSRGRAGKKECTLVKRYGGMVALVRCSEYGSNITRSMACKVMRNLVFYSELRLPLLHAGGCSALSLQLLAKNIQDQYNAMEVLDMCAQRCFATKHESTERPNLYESWRQLCRSCNARCGKTCQRPEYEAARLIGSDSVLNTLFRFLHTHDITKRFGSLMLLHKLAAGPGVNAVVASACLRRKRSGTLYIEALEGRGLPNMDDLGAMDPYVKCRLRAPPQQDIIKQTNPALDAGGDCKWTHEHNNVMRFRYDVHAHDTDILLEYASQYWKEKQVAEEDPFLDDEIKMVPPGRVRLHVQVMDFDQVGEHDLSGETEIDITEDIGMSLMSDTRWLSLAPETVILHQGDTEPKVHNGCYGPGGEVRVRITFIADGSSIASEPHSSPSHISRERRLRNARKEKTQKKGAKLWGKLQDDWRHQEKKCRPSGQEGIIGAMLSTEPGEGVAALSIWQNMARLEETRSQMISSGGALESLLPLLYQSLGTGNDPEVLGFELLDALDNFRNRCEYIAKPIHTDDYVFVRILAATVVLAGKPMPREAENVDFGMSDSEIADDLRQELIEMLSRPSGVGQKIALRLKQIQAIPHLLRFLTNGECCGEEKKLVETSMGGSLNLDSYVSAFDVRKGDMLMRKRHERRRMSAYILEQLAAHKEVVPILNAPHVVIFLIRVIQENWLYRMSGEFHHLDGVYRAMYQISSRSACRALSYIARDTLSQPLSRHEVANSVLQMSALRDITALASLPVDAKEQGQDGGKGYALDVDTAQAAVELLGSIVPRVNEGLADEQLLEVEAMKAIQIGAPDGKALVIMAKESTPVLSNIIQLAGVPKADGSGVRHPHLLNATLFTISRIACTSQTADAVRLAGGVKKLTFLVPPPPRLNEEFKQPRLVGGDYRPLGASLVSSAHEESRLLRMLPPTIYTLLASLARSRNATEDMCAYGFLERAIERFFTLTSYHHVDLKSWGEIALFFARLSRGGKNVKGYGSVNEVLMKCNVAQKLYQMAIPDHIQHRRVRLHALIALVNMSQDPLLCTPLMMGTRVTVPLALDIATNSRESISNRRQALLILRNVAAFPDKKYHSDLIDAGVIEPLQAIGRNFTAEVEQRQDGTTVKKVHITSNDADSSVESMSIPTLGQIARDILERLGHAMDTGETHKVGDSLRVGPFGIEVDTRWIPLYLRDTKDGVEEADARRNLGIKNIDLYKYDPVSQKNVPHFLMNKVDGGDQFYNQLHNVTVEDDEVLKNPDISLINTEKRKKKKKRKPKQNFKTQSPEKLYVERYGKSRSDQGSGGFFACGVHNCAYIGKTYAHLSLHCALSHFCSHYDIPITSTRSYNPADEVFRRKLPKYSLAQSSIMDTPISRWNFPSKQRIMDDSISSATRPLLLDPIFSPTAPLNTCSPSVGTKEGKKKERLRRQRERNVRRTEKLPNMVEVQHITRVHGHEVTVKHMKLKTPPAETSSILNIFATRKKMKMKKSLNTLASEDTCAAGIHMVLNHRQASTAIGKPAHRPIEVQTPSIELGMVKSNVDVALVSPLRVYKKDRGRKKKK